MRLHDWLLLCLIAILLIGSLVMLSINYDTETISRVIAMIDTATLEPDSTRTPWPTFTPSATIDPAQLIPTETSTPLPTATFTPGPPTDTPPPAAPPTDTPDPAPDLRVNTNILNIRSGPGTAYNRIASVENGHSSKVLGRNNDNSWVLIDYPRGQGWVASRLTQIDGDLSNVDVIQVQPPPPPPAAPPPPPANNPAPPPPAADDGFPYKLTNVFGEKNGGITQIRGFVKNSSGGPADGVRVRVRIGSFCTVSVPTGKPGVYPSGNYDVLLRPYASDGVWQVSIVDGPPQDDNFKCEPTIKQLSEEVRVTTSTVEGVTYVEFQRK